MTATVSAFIDRWHPKKDSSGREVAAVSIRVTFDRRKRYYPTGIDLNAKDFDRIMSSRRRSEADKAVYNKIQAFEAKARSVTGKLQAFTFDRFEKLYIQNRSASDSVSFAFTEYINELIAEGRIGTAGSYESARISINKFKKDLRFADVCKPLLQKYEKWMVDSGNSLATIGIYLRSLRAVYNRAELDETLYPFGKATKDRYTIPTGRNIKKALTISDVGRIHHCYLQPGSSLEMSRDYWMFIYLSNGINVKDLCLLQYKNIEGEELTYQRAKTRRALNNGSVIKVYHQPLAAAIIKKWGQPAISPESYVFPHLTKGITPVKERQVVQQLTQFINKNMKKVAAALNINTVVTTYTARHSFATVLKRSDASIAFISEALGHSSETTTKNYLANFEIETVKKVTSALTEFPISADA